MRVEVRILSGLIHGQGGPTEVDDGANGADLLREIGVGSTQGIIMIVNGRRQDLTFEIREGDKVHFMTPLAGG